MSLITMSGLLDMYSPSVWIGMLVHVALADLPVATLFFWRIYSDFARDFYSFFLYNHTLLYNRSERYRRSFHPLGFLNPTKN